MNLKQWAEREGVHHVTAYRWFKQGKLPVPARKVGRLILVEQPGDQPQGRRLLVVDSAEVDDDLVPDVTGILTSLCARLYGRRAAANRARRAIEAATKDVPS